MRWAHDSCCASDIARVIHPRENIRRDYQCIDDGPSQVQTRLSLRLLYTYSQRSVGQCRWHVKITGRYTTVRAHSRYYKSSVDSVCYVQAQKNPGKHTAEKRTSVTMTSVKERSGENQGEPGKLTTSGARSQTLFIMRIPGPTTMTH